MNVLTIIQARMTSTRLPGKVLMPLAGKTVLEHVVERARKGWPDAYVVVATPAGDAQRPIEDLCEQLPPDDVTSCAPEVAENDVLSRYVVSALAYHATACFVVQGALSRPVIIVRLTADCPLLDPAMIRRVIEAGGDWRSIDYVRGRRAVEAFPLDVLLRASRRSTSPYEREHVCPWMYDPENGMRCVLIDDDRPNYSVDTAEDLERARRVLERKADATWNDVDMDMTGV